MWARIPNMKECKGKCANSCGPIGCSSLETKLIEERAGRELVCLPVVNSCSMLKNGRCSVYGIRPVICRLWGVVPSMPCPHGCEPEWELSDQEGYGILAESMKFAGDDDAYAMEQLVKNATPEFWAAMKDHCAGAPDLGGHIIASRRPAAKALFDAADEIRERIES